MIRIGLLTLFNNTNYGNRLQNYASQVVLESLNCYVESLYFDTYLKPNVFKRVCRIFNLSISETLTKIVTIIIQSKRKNHCRILQNEREKSNKSFTEENIVTSDCLISGRNILDKLDQQYDYFIVGSDQVWNPYSRIGLSVYFLTFAPYYKRISYAASFGVSELPRKIIKKYRRWLSDIPFISVREEAGASIIKELIDKDVDVLIDPTMMLTKAQWQSISKPGRNKPKQKYFVTYFLGDLPQDSMTLIQDLHNYYKFEQVGLADQNFENYYAADPGEFLDFMNSSSIVLTDSYHGTIFSILFEKPFVVFDRLSKSPSLGTRIDTLLSTFHLENRKWSCLQETSDLFNIDYAHVPAIIEYERQKTYDYLKNALNI